MSAELDRWCTRLAAAYPDRARAAEVALTLAESNEGRRRPRVGDAVDVMRHGLAARLGGRAAGRAARWGDAFSVALVLMLVVQAAAAVAMVGRAFLTNLPREATRGDVLLARRLHIAWEYYPFADQRSARIGLVAAVCAVALAVAACLGRVRLARLLTALTAAAGTATFVAESAVGNGIAFRSVLGFLVVSGLVLAALAVLATPAVARAAAVVPRVGWIFPAQAAMTGAACAMATHWWRRDWWPYPGRVGPLAAAYAAAVLALAVAAALVAWRAPALAGGAALLLLAVVPLAPALRLIDQLHDVSGLAVWGAFALVLVPQALLAFRRLRPA